MTDEEIAAVYKKTFESTPGCARTAPTAAPLVIAFGHALIAAYKEDLAFEIQELPALPEEVYIGGEANMGYTKEQMIAYGYAATDIAKEKA